MYDFDVVRISSGELYGPYKVSSTMLSTGWVGGTWCKYDTAISFRDGSAIRVDRTLGVGGPMTAIGFILRASYEETDQYTSFYPGKTGVVTVCQTGHYLFKYFETLDLAERTTPGSGSALVYSLNQNLYVSSNGLLTNEIETASARVIGYCSGVPADNDNYLGADVLFP